MDPGPPPGPGWTLGEDGHWKPPPFETGGSFAPPSSPAPPQGGVPPWPPPAHGQQAPQWPPPGARSTGTNAGVVVAAVLGAFAVVAVVCIAAVTMLGTTTTDDSFDQVSSPTIAQPSPDPTTATGGTGSEDEPEPEPEVSGQEALATSKAVADHVGSHEWDLIDQHPLPLESIESCSPSGWNNGAVNRHSSVYEHKTGSGTDGEVTVNVTVYGDEADAAADLDRAGGSEWFACKRQQFYDTYGDANPRFEAIPEDPQAPGVAYIEHFVADGERGAETIHYVFVGRARATITYCGCTTVGLDGRQEVARDVAAALAQVQGLPAPGRDGT
jgi:hypothetical protein